MMKTTIRAMQSLDIIDCAKIARQSAVAEVYGFTETNWTTDLSVALNAKESILFVAEWEGETAGFAWVHPHGAFQSAPYLRFIAVNPLFRGKGIGSDLIREFERQTRHIRRDFLVLVSDFNFEAQSLYTKLGYQKVGELPGFLVSGVTEFIMVKKWSIEGA